VHLAPAFTLVHGAAAHQQIAVSTHSLGKAEIAMPELPPYPGAPRWVKVTAIIAGILVLVLVALLHAGLLHPPGTLSLHGGAAPEHTGHR
jgi:hypothetical protein